MSYIFDSKKDVISMANFLSNIEFFDGFSYKTKSSFKHKELKVFNCNYVKTISFKLVEKNPEFVLQGNVFLVEDRKFDIAPYVNPFHLKLIESGNTIDKCLKKARHEKIRLEEICERWNDYHKLILEKERLEEINLLLKELGIIKCEKRKEFKL